MTRDDVIDVLTAVAAADRRTVGEADVDVWQAIIGELPKALALQAVRDHMRHMPGVWLTPGHVYQGARAIKRDQLEREPDEIREARQRALEAKAAEIAEAKALAYGEPKTGRRPSSNVRSVRCPWCKAGVGSPCMIPHTNQVLRAYHPMRIDAADTSRDETPGGTTYANHA